MVFVNVLIDTLFALLTPGDKRGRVNGVVNSAVNVSRLLGLAAASPLAATIGMGLGGIGVFTLAVVGVCLCLPGYRELNRSEPVLRGGLGEGDGPGQSLQA